LAPRVISSGTIRFFVGPNKREFVAHAAVIAGQSQPLHNLVYGNFSEAKPNHAFLESVDELAFVLLCEYAYTGDYNLEVAPQDPAPNGTNFEEPQDEAPAVEESKDEEHAIEEPIAVNGDDDWGLPTRKTSKKRKSRKRDRLWRGFTSATYLDSSIVSTGPPYDPTECKNPGDALLAHTKVYLLADYYAVPKLVSLSLDKLHQTLCAYDVNGDTIEGIVDLLQLAFEEETPDLLRSMFSLFAACHVEKLWESENFRQLLSTYGDLSKRLVGSMLGRLD